MGRPSTGAYTTKECLRLELSELKKAGLFVEGETRSTTWQWTDWRDDVTATIKIAVNYEFRIPRIILHYTVNGMPEHRIILTEFVPSNLGKGKVMYFICPNTGKRCRILYMAYGCTYFKSLGAYENRIYYRSQIQSKRWYSMFRLRELGDEIDAMFKAGIRATYKGKPTRRWKILQKKRDEAAQHGAKTRLHF